LLHTICRRAKKGEALSKRSSCRQRQLLPKEVRKQMKLGFIGLGAMGAPMVGNLLRAGHELAVWNRTPERVDPLMEAGAHRADSPADAASDTRATILMLTNAEAAQEVLFGDKGVVEGLPAGAAVINMGTIGAVATMRIAKTLGDLGYRMLDAPVAGSTPVAVAGELDIMVGGDEQSFEEFEPVLSAMGEKISHMGEVGSGARMKLINNLLLGANMAILSEGLALGEAAGIPVEKQLEVLLAGGAASGVAQRKGGNLISRSYEPQFKLSHELKDLYYALELGRDLEEPLPITAVVSQIYNAGMREHAEDDMSAVAEVYRERVNARLA
jgi:2-hydroxy-3-oxopropionate reductase